MSLPLYSVCVVDTRPLFELTRLGRGDTEALAVALELKSWVLLDDLKARNYAKLHGPTVIGTLGLLVALHQNKLAQCSPEDDLELLAKGLWIRPELLGAALEQMKD